MFIFFLTKNVNKIDFVEYFLLDKSNPNSLDMIKALPKQIENRAMLENLKRLEIQGGEKQ